MFICLFLEYQVISLCRHEFAMFRKTNEASFAVSGRQLRAHALELLGFILLLMTVILFTIGS